MWRSLAIHAPLLSLNPVSGFTFTPLPVLPVGVISVFGSPNP